MCGLFYLGNHMKKLFINLCMKISGKNKKELARDWTIHYFVTRSTPKAYWRAIFH